MILPSVYMTSTMCIYELYTDGGCDPNPGPASAAGVCIHPETKEVIFAYSHYLGKGTNNIAELTAILMGLRECIDRDLKNLRVFTDSELSVHLCQGRKQSQKPHLTALVQKIHALKPSFQSLEFQWIQSHNHHLYNETADQLCTHMLKTAANLTRPAKPLAMPSAMQAMPSAKPIEDFFEKKQTSKPHRIMLHCSFQEKDTVKALGAKWNPGEKKWVVMDTPENRSIFQKWLPDGFL